MDDDDDDCLAFWRRNRVNLTKLVYPAIRALKCSGMQQVQQWSVFSATVVSFWHLTVVECWINYCQTLYILKCNKSLTTYHT